MLLVASTIAGCGDPQMASGAGCVESADEPPALLLADADVDDGSSVLADLRARPGGWRQRQEYRVVVSGKAVREAEELTGTAGEPEAIQALYVNDDDWTEFARNDGRWSNRSSADPTWVAGVVRPEEEMAYELALALPLGLADGAEDRVFEGTVVVDGTTLQRWCTQHPADVVPPSLPGVFRFVVHPDGYVVEWVALLREPGRVECMEGTMEFSSTVGPPGLVDHLPREWMTDLQILSSCRDEIEASTS